MVVRLIGPRIQPGSFAALPRTIFEASPGYARIEDPPDSRQKMQKLIIVAGPDIFNVNLITKTGTHARKTAAENGETPLLPIVLPFDPQHRLGILDRIEFGSEYDFFTQAGAVKENGPIINAQTTTALRLDTPLGAAVLVLRGDSGIPVTFSWQMTDGKYAYEYIEYQDRPFDPKLFTKPTGIEIRELRSDPHL